MHYKQLYLSQKRVSSSLVLLNVFLLLLFLGSLQVRNNLKKELDFITKKELGLEKVALEYKKGYDALPQCQLELRNYKEGKVFVGRVSYYSHDGCLGCSKNQIMANGQKFDETKMTLAFNKLPLNTVVRVTNLSNGKSELAVVTDRGGFERYGRIADLSKGLFEALEAATDASIIKIEEIK